MHTRRALDALVLDVELVLISVVQGVALVALSDHGGRLLEMHRWELLPLMLTGLFYILVFWSAAIIHTISFVSWPLDLVHNLLYFCASLIEVLTFRQMGHPAAWFIYSMTFFLMVEVLYLYDYWMIRSRRASFADGEPQRRLYAHMVSRQRLEMFVLVPIGTIFNAAAAWTVARSPGAWMPFAIVQLGLAVAFLTILLGSFRHRMRLIGACSSSEPHA